MLGGGVAGRPGCERLVDEGEAVGLGGVLGALYSSAGCPSVIRNPHTRPFRASFNKSRSASLSKSPIIPSVSAIPTARQPRSTKCHQKGTHQHFNNCGIAGTLRLPGSELGYKYLLRRLGVVRRS